MNILFNAVEKAKKITFHMTQIPALKSRHVRGKTKSNCLNSFIGLLQSAASQSDILVSTTSAHQKDSLLTRVPTRKRQKWAHRPNPLNLSPHSPKRQNLLPLSLSLLPFLSLTTFSLSTHSLTTTLICHHFEVFLHRSKTNRRISPVYSWYEIV